MSEPDVVRAVGAAFDGRKGVVDALTGFPEVPSDHRGRGGGLETLAAFALVFVNVHAPEAGRRRRYANEFWVARDDFPGDARVSSSRNVRMSWFGGGGDAGSARGVAKALAETTALQEHDAFFSPTATAAGGERATARGDADENENETKTKTKKKPSSCSSGNRRGRTCAAAVCARWPSPAGTTGVGRALGWISSSWTPRR
jgi:hypothetical protein